ncbi:GNAT family N-acetyltransferase [Tenacibaculum sp.]|nr:GNAT family N-acetyltransferase [Tenacibaculum sp.]
MIEIKVATNSDVEVIALLGRITYTESHGKYIENKDDLLNYNNKAFSIENTRVAVNKSNNIFYILYYNNLPIGYAKLVLNISFENLTKPNSCRLERIYILNDFLPLKLGQQLYNIVIEKALSLKFDTIWLSVYIKNERAINFYKKNKFTSIGTLQFKVDEREYPNTVFSKALTH